MKFSSKVLHIIVDPFLRILSNYLHKLENEVALNDGSVKGDGKSPVRFEIIGESFKLHDDHPPIAGFPGSVPYVTSSILNIRKSVVELKNNPMPGNTEISKEQLDQLKTYSKSLGVDEVGYTTIPQEWIFRDKAIQYNHAIVLVLEMDKKRMDLAPNLDTAVMVHETYDHLGRASNRIAAWLREKGFAAHAGHPLMGMALYPPIAQSAGLGWRSISGLLITPQFGPRVRLAAVFTDIQNLPVFEGNEHEWILEYCNICRRCINECPPKAIYDNPIYHDNGLVTSIDNSKCFPYFENYHGCSICIKVCPFNNTPYEDLKSNIESYQANSCRVLDKTDTSYGVKQNESIIEPEVI